MLKRILIFISLVVLGISIYFIVSKLFTGEDINSVVFWTAILGFSGGLLSFLAGVFGYIEKLIPDRTAMKIHKIPIEREISEIGYKRLLSFCNFLREDLNRIDLETSWSSEYFTPLDAEVEVKKGTKKKRKITDLLTAIRSDKKSKVFLVLGDPGSGKSVALRKLCRDLLNEEVRKTKKVPLYINLKEWEIKEIWSEDNPPTVQQLYSFVLNNLKERGDVFANKFLDDYFEILFSRGYLFFILDSFDEIPAVLDVDESSWIIKKLSEVIYRFLGGAHESRGILASRIFRRPTQDFSAQTILEIRPFSEIKILENMQRFFPSNGDLLAKTLQDRSGLEPAIKNPFICSLLIDYYNKNHSIPKNQADMFESYVKKRLELCQEKISIKKITIELIIKCAIEIANVMFSTSKYGYGVPFDDLEIKLPQFKNQIKDVIEILLYSRLGRIGKGKEKKFSFAHRRFSEFFLVQKLIQNPERVKVESIPADSRWRDSLVLFCEIADEKEVKKIGKFCWEEIRKIVRDDIENWRNEKNSIEENLANEEYYYQKIKSFSYRKRVKYIFFGKKVGKEILRELLIKEIESKYEIKLDISSPKFLRAVHALRFLKDAFRARVDCINDFRDKLSEFIDYIITKSNSLLCKKLALEALGLLEEKKLESIIIKAFNLSNPWITEAAFYSCRLLPKINLDFKINLIDYFRSMGLVEFYHRSKELFYSSSLSDAFKFLNSALKAKRIEIYSLYLAIILFSLMLFLDLFILVINKISILQVFWIMFVGVDYLFIILAVITFYSSNVRNLFFYSGIKPKLTLFFCCFFYIGLLKETYSGLYSYLLFWRLSILFLFFPWYLLYIMPIYIKFSLKETIKWIIKYLRALVITLLPLLLLVYLLLQLLAINLENVVSWSLIFLGIIGLISIICLVIKGVLNVKAFATTKNYPV